MAVAVRTGDLLQRLDIPLRDAAEAEAADVRPEAFDAYGEIISTLRRVTA